MIAATQCPKCGEQVKAKAVICPRCDYILNIDFITDLALDDSTTDSHAALAVSSAPDAVMLGDLGDDVALMWSEHTGSFLTMDTREVERQILKAPVYVSKRVQELMRPDAVLAQSPDLEARKGMLSPFELHVLSFIDGNRPVARLRKKTGLDGDDLRIAVGMLADKQAVVLVGYVRRPDPAARTEGDDDDDDESGEHPFIDPPQTSPASGAPMPVSGISGPVGSTSESVLDMAVGGPAGASAISGIIPTDKTEPVSSEPLSATQPNPVMVIADPVVGAPPLPPLPRPLPPLPARAPPATSPSPTPTAPSQVATRPALPLPALPTAAVPPPAPQAQRSSSTAAPIPSPVFARSRAAAAKSEARAAAFAEEQKARAANFHRLALQELEAGNRTRAGVYASLACKSDPNDQKLHELRAHITKSASKFVSKDAAMLAGADDAERAGNHERALALMQQAVMLSPSSASAHNRLGILLAVRFRRFGEASEALLRAVELDPNNAAFKNNLGKIVALAEKERGLDSGEGGVLKKLKKAFK